MKKVLFVAMLFAGSLMAQTKKQYLITLDTAEVHSIGKSKFIDWKLGDTVAVIYSMSPTDLLIENISSNPIVIETNGTCGDGTFETIDFVIESGHSRGRDCYNCAIYLKDKPSRFIGKSGYSLIPLGSFK